MDYQSRPPKPVIVRGVSPEEQLYAVLGYRLLDTTGKEADEFIQTAVKVGEDTKYLAVPVTLEQLTFMRQIIPLLEKCRKQIEKSAQKA